jgi:hypothetical protein
MQGTGKFLFSYTKNPYSSRRALFVSVKYPACPPKRGALMVMPERDGEGAPGYEAPCRPEAENDARADGVGGFGKPAAWRNCSIGLTMKSHSTATVATSLCFWGIRSRAYPGEVPSIRYDAASRLIFPVARPHALTYA